jgi:prepilin-type N-terminal cleavage/methylation domain-containing protein
MIQDSRNKKRGFTIIEMVLAVAVFTVVSLIAAGALLAIADANRKAQTFKSVVNNVNFALESIARNLRTGRSYSSEDFNQTSSCLTGYKIGISFTSQEDENISYYLSGTQIMRKVGSETAVGITAPEVKITKFCLRVLGTGATDDTQPNVLMLVSGLMEGRERSQSRFDIQTLITQRLIDG